MPTKGQAWCHSLCTDDFIQPLREQDTLDSVTSVDQMLKERLSLDKEMHQSPQI